MVSNGCMRTDVSGAKTCDGRHGGGVERVGVAAALHPRCTEPVMLHFVTFVTLRTAPARERQHPLRPTQRWRTKLWRRWTRTGGRLRNRAGSGDAGVRRPTDSHEKTSDGSGVTKENLSPARTRPPANRVSGASPHRFPRLTMDRERVCVRLSASLKRVRTVDVAAGDTSRAPSRGTRAKPAVRAISSPCDQQSVRTNQPGGPASMGECQPAYQPAHAPVGLKQRGGLRAGSTSRRAVCERRMGSVVSCGTFAPSNAV
jgi:hypothetical protein